MTLLSASLPIHLVVSTPVHVSFGAAAGEADGVGPSQVSCRFDALNLELRLVLVYRGGLPSALW